MPDLFGNVTSQLPPWLTNQPTGSQIVDKAFQAKQQAFRNFSDLTELSMRVQQQDALLPLQIRAAQQRVASTGLDLAGEQLAQQNQLETKAGMVALADRLQTTKDWASPDSVNSVWSIIKDHPALGLTKEGQTAISQAEAMHRVATMADTRLQTAETAAQARIDAINAAAAARSVDLENRLKSAEKISDDRNKTILEKEDRANKAEMETTILQLEKAGFNLTDHAKLAALKGEITAINQDPTMAADPNKKRVAIQNAAAKYTASSSAPRASASAPPAQSGPSRPKTKVEYDALPVGAEFIDPGDGKTYRKTK